MLSLLTSRVFLSDSKVLDENWDGLSVKDSFWRIFYHNREGASLELPGGQFVIPAERCIILPDWVPFVCRCKAPVVQHFVHFDIPVLSPIDSKRLFPGPITLPESEPYLSLGNLWRSSMDEGACPQISANSFTHAFVEAVCAYLVSSLDAAGIQILSERLQPDSRITKVINEIEAHIGSELTLASLAERANLSRDHLIRLFRRKLGLTPKQYILDLRIKKAARLLNSTRYSIEQIAEELGFSDRYHFTRAFNQSMGINPGEYRRSFQPSSAKAPD